MTELTNKETFSFKKYNFGVHPHHTRIFHDFNIAQHFDYRVDKHNFKFFSALKNYLDDNENLSVYLTADPLIENFKYYGNDVVLNIDGFIKFCTEIGHSKKVKARTKAFFGQHILLQNINLSDDEKKLFIQASLNEQDLVNAISNLSIESQNKLLSTILSLSVLKDDQKSSASNEQFINIFSKFIKEQNVQNFVLDSLPQIQLDTLKQLKEFISQNLNQNEKFFQDWIDEDNGKYRRKRCLIFGIDYIHPKREGEIMGRKRFDILATLNREKHILIELKSPSAELFKIETKENTNDGITTTYYLSDELARAIPQILGYKRWYKEMPPEKLQEFGISEAKEIAECIIVIGQRKIDDIVWAENLKSLNEALKIKIVTYTDLIEKMENVIHNLEQNL